MRLCILGCWLLCFSAPILAADWQFLGDSSAGQHYVDPATLQWESGRQAFDIETRVVERDASAWEMRLGIDCKAERFRYQRGRQLRDGKTIVSFDRPQPEEAITAGSMPDQLYKEYCRTADRPDITWQAVGKSEIATVYYDPASVRQNRDSTHFKVNTRVTPFKNEAQTFSSLSFDCKAQMFTVLRMSKVANGETERIFDRPQKATAVAKTATLSTLAQKFCGKPAPEKAGNDANACDSALAKLRGIEAQVQYDFDQGDLQCKRAEQYLKDLGAIRDQVQKHHCKVADLDGYLQTVKQAGCGK